MNFGICSRFASKYVKNFVNCLWVDWNCLYHWILSFPGAFQLCILAIALVTWSYFISQSSWYTPDVLYCFCYCFSDFCRITVDLWWTVYFDYYHCLLCSIWVSSLKLLVFLWADRVLRLSRGFCLTYISQQLLWPG